MRGTVVDPFFGSHLWAALWCALGFHLYNQVIQLQADLTIHQKKRREMSPLEHDKVASGAMLRYMSSLPKVLVGPWVFVLVLGHSNKLVDVMRILSDERLEILAQSKGRFDRVQGPRWPLV